MAKGKKVNSPVVVSEEYRDKYKLSDVRTPSGAKSISCGDQVAQALNGLDVAQLGQVAKAAGLDFKKWSHLNPGMQRMNLGNSLRARAESAEHGAVAKKAISLGKGMERTGKVPVKKVKKAKSAKQTKGKAAPRKKATPPAQEAAS
jgi:colicin import membrane protein